MFRKKKTFYVIEVSGFLCSTWTIDLCYILKHYSVNHKFCTKTIGVDPSLSSESFYSKTLSMVDFQFVDG